MCSEYIMLRIQYLLLFTYFVLPTSNLAFQPLHFVFRTFVPRISYLETYLCQYNYVYVEPDHHNFSRRPLLSS